MKLPRLLTAGRLFLPLLALAFALAGAAYALVWAVDPYDLRPSGARIRLSERPYVDRLVPRLVSVAAKDGSDLVVLGGSTTLGFSKPMLRETFPEANKPENLSITGISIEDFRLSAERLLASPSLKRVLLVMDVTLFRETGAEAQVTRYLAPARWHDPAPEFEGEAVLAALHALRTGELGGPGWFRKDVERPDYLVGKHPLSENARDLATYRAATPAMRKLVEPAGLTPCEALPAVEGILLPLIQRFRARGVVVDLVIPPYSLATYAHWTADQRAWRRFGGADQVWPRLMGFRRCMVEGAAKIEGVRVFAFDNDTAITADLANYQDTSHLLALPVYRTMLMRIARGESTLTPASWPDYITRLKSSVLAFNP